jgi:hypothetical protein
MEKIQISFAEQKFNCEEFRVWGRKTQDARRCSFPPCRPCALDLLSKVITEKAGLWMPSPRRDEGADKHPQPKSNAGIGVLRPVL